MTWLKAIQDFPIDWSIIEATFPHVASMQACIQDSIHHAEGDVWTHTKMVAEALPCFDLETKAARIAALYHDVEKPSTRIVEWVGGRECVRHPFHARYGAQTAWFELYQTGLDLETRLAVYAIILWHQKVFHAFSYSDLQRLAQTYAAIGDWTTLINFARADNAGRYCENPKSTENELQLLQIWIDENLINLDNSSRMVYLEKEHRSVHYQAMDPMGSRVIVLSGLPGVGKDEHIVTHLDGISVVSLDAIRRENKILPTDDQGKVIQIAFEEAKKQLRIKAPFVWNATGLTRLQRGKIISICRAYDAHVSIHCLDKPLKTVLKQNRVREFIVPESIIIDLARKWEPATKLEAHDVIWF